MVVTTQNLMYMMWINCWRRKYFIATGCVVWIFFYLYIHYSVDSGDEQGSDGLNVKYPVNIHSSHSNQFLAKLSSKRMKPPTTESPTPSNKEFTMSPALIEPWPILQFSKFFKTRANTDAEVVDKRKKSIREKYVEQGIKPTSFVVRSRPKFVSAPVNVTLTIPPKFPAFVPPLRLVHFDLKGAPPKISFFKSIFPLIRQAGANGILMEYEDTFPFWGNLSNIATSTSYKKNELRYILELAKNNKLKVIPLVQTFGHLEFVLKLEEFKHLREVEDIPQSLCPTNNGSLKLVKNMIDQIMSLHPDSQWLHIGSDEVYQLGHCSRCSRYERNSLFLAYVKKVAKYVREKHNVTPIIWDDMLRHTTVAELKKYEMGKLVEPMAWSYVEDVYLFLPSSLWEKYGEVFPYMWTASAFKGAFGETLTVPDAKRHLENNKAWLTVMREQNSTFKGFRGIALTGWQRYDHFASLCELLPAAIPSLILNLLTVSKGRFDYEVFPKMQELLECSSRMHYHLDLDHDPSMWKALGVCFFPGSSVFRITLRHYDVTKSLDKYIYDITVHKGWMTEYNVNHNFSSPLRVNEMLRDFSYYNSSLQMLQEAAVRALREVYDDDTVSEWIELNIYPYVKKMNEIWKHGLKLKKYQTWPRRPLARLISLPAKSNVDLGFVTS
ncbi:hexosaminidase D-like [Uloborus diversus]|uniref:hexosaminidase D-like n=1 Tax=Uloborus diversus TaxID=327109 RepID=UPI00240A1EBC|nr:hexosaminidase D-like [Uloborus diversus]